MIYVPSNRFVEAPQLDACLKVEGWLTLRARRRSGRVTRERQFRVTRRSPRFHNTFLNNGLNAFFELSPNSGFLYRASVGTGTTPPAFTDTALVNFAGLVNPGSFVAPANNGGFTVGTPGYTWRTYTWTSEIGALGTLNITEIGIGAGTTDGTNLHVRELVRDSGGDPVAFPLTDEEALELTYELRLYHPNDDAEVGITISASPHDVLVRPIGAGSSPNAWSLLASSSNTISSQLTGIRAWTGDLAPKDRRADNAAAIGTSLGSASGANVPYSSGNYYQDVTGTFGPTVGNGNIRTVVVNWAVCSFQFQYDPVIVKTDTQQLVLPFRLSLARGP